MKKLFSIVIILVILSCNKEQLADQQPLNLKSAKTIFYSAAKSVTVTTNAAVCGVGYRGGKVTYTVPAKKYTSTSSQQDADTKAFNDANSNAQNYADAHPDCDKIFLYHNDAFGIMFTKNDCENGKTGSQVAYMVKAGLFWSLKSKMDAQIKATRWIEAHGQRYANEHGTCK